MLGSLPGFFQGDGPHLLLLRPFPAARAAQAQNVLFPNAGFFTYSGYLHTAILWPSHKREVEGTSPNKAKQKSQCSLEGREVAEEPAKIVPPAGQEPFVEGPGLGGVWVCVCVCVSPASQKEPQTASSHGSPLPESGFPAWLPRERHPLDLTLEPSWLKEMGWGVCR